MCVYAGNEVQMLNAKECNKVVDGLCRTTGRTLICKIHCMALCGSFSAHGECREDKNCHCNCC